MDVRAENRAESAALDEDVSTQSHLNEIVVLRVDYFENYAGRFLSVEAKDRLGGAAPSGSTYVEPTLSLSWNVGNGRLSGEFVPGRIGLAVCALGAVALVSVAAAQAIPMSSYGNTGRFDRLTGH